MSIFQDLGQEYRDIDELFLDTREAISLGNEGAVPILYELAARKLIACMRAEDAVVYPQFADIAELVETVTSIRSVHERIEGSLGRLEIAGLDGEAWSAEIERLICLLGVSIDLKELSLFPIAGLAMTTQQLVQIGVDFATSVTHSASVMEFSNPHEPLPDAPATAVYPMPALDSCEPCEADDVIPLGLEDLEPHDHDRASILDRHAM